MSTTFTFFSYILFICDCTNIYFCVLLYFLPEFPRCLNKWFLEIFLQFLNLTFQFMKMCKSFWRKFRETNGHYSLLKTLVKKRLSKSYHTVLSGLELVELLLLHLRTYEKSFWVLTGAYTLSFNWRKQTFKCKVGIKM